MSKREFQRGVGTTSYTRTQLEDVLKNNLGKSFNNIKVFTIKLNFDTNLYSLLLTIPHNFEDVEMTVKEKIHSISIEIDGIRFQDLAEEDKSKRFILSEIFLWQPGGLNKHIPLSIPSAPQPFTKLELYQQQEELEAHILAEEEKKAAEKKALEAVALENKRDYEIGKIYNDLKITYQIEHKQLMLDWTNNQEKYGMPTDYRDNVYQNYNNGVYAPTIVVDSVEYKIVVDDWLGDYNEYIWDNAFNDRLRMYVTIFNNEYNFLKTTQQGRQRVHYVYDTITNEDNNYNCYKYVPEKQNLTLIPSKKIAGAYTFWKETTSAEDSSTKPDIVYSQISPRTYFKLSGDSIKIKEVNNYNWNWFKKSEDFFSKDILVIETSETTPIWLYGSAIDKWFEIEGLKKESTSGITLNELNKAVSKIALDIIPPKKELNLDNIRKVNERKQIAQIFNKSKLKIKGQ